MWRNYKILLKDVKEDLNKLSIQDFITSPNKEREKIRYKWLKERFKIELSAINTVTQKMRVTPRRKPAKYFHGFSARDPTHMIYMHKLISFPYSLSNQ